MDRTAVELQHLASAHLWGHSSPLVLDDGEQIEIIERGEGCYVWDQHGRRYLDGLSGLFTVQVGHGRAELAEAAGKQAAQLAYFPIWTYAHPAAIELAAKLAELAPGDLNRAFFTTGGSEAVESAWKLARQYFQAIGQPGRYKVISRDIAYHGTSMGALAITGIPELRAPFEPLVPGAFYVANTNRYRCDLCAHAPACTLSCADDIERTILQEGPESVAAVFLEPVQNAGGCFTPPEGYFARVREICDRYGVLLISDEVICAFGRLGTWFGCERIGYQPDMVTMAKGLTSGYAPLGGVMVSDKIAAPFLEPDSVFMHGITFAGHPVSCAVALANIEVFERDGILDNVLANEAAFRSALATLEDLPWVGEIRGMGYFYAIELVKDKATKAEFEGDEADRLLRFSLSPRLFELGLICRADDRGDPVIQLSPPLIAGPEQFDEIVTIIRRALTESMEALYMPDTATTVVTTTVGVPREIKADEHRVAITPDGVREIGQYGVTVLIEAGAGADSSFPDDDYRRAGAEIVAAADEVWERSDLICKVKEPLESEFGHFRPDLTLFTYLHLAAYPGVAEALLANKVTGIAYETVEAADGSLPLLAPMSEVAGRMSAQIGAHYLERHNGGRGVLMGGAPGVRPARVAVLGAGNVGWNAAWMCAGMEAEVDLLDKNVDRLRFIDQIQMGRITTLTSNRGQVERVIAEADLVIGAVLVPGGRAPVVVTEDMIRSMKTGAVVVDIAIDQGGCIETSHETSHADPVFEKHGVVHYAVGNMPGAVPFTSTYALTNVTVPFLAELARFGPAEAARRDHALALGFNTAGGHVTNEAVAEAVGAPYTPVADAIGGS